MSNRSNYTIGWICALSTEQIAAEELLDEEHQAPEDIPPSDSNHYTLGSIGKHNVVITVLPRDEYGIASVANVATNLLSSFPNIRIGLLVGIGGGAPSEKHDIRLGDIVVSAASAGDGGVFQYDFGKTIQGESFQYTGFLNKPPTVLRTAVAALETQYRRKGHRLEEGILDILRKNKRLKKEFGRPQAASDRLFRPGVIHNPGGCASACAQDESNLIMRCDRIEDEEDDPAIHYGLIASANQLMKDASIRDKLSAEKDVLCFEMEAAGLVNHFPCLVIRGICDYSDSHKNKEWQGYAAMTAAAYAKDLIRQLHPIHIEAEQRLSEVHDKILDTTMEIKTDVQNIRSQLQSEENCEILKWLSDSDYSIHHNDYIYRRQKGTGLWLLDSKEYQDWLSTSKQKLFCPGIPGAGKTILTAIVIDNLHTRFLDDSTVGVAYHYCNFKRQDEQTAVRLMASLLKQLCAYQPSLPDVVKAVHKRHAVSNTRPSLDEMSTALQSVAGIYSRVFIAIDALDECQLTERSLFLSMLFNLQAKTEVNIFATSRPILEIEKLFNGCQSIDIVASQDDVYKYIDGHISQLPDFVQHNPELREQIKMEISTSVQGMFLLAQLYLGSLEDKVTPKEMRQALDRVRLQAQKDRKVEILHAAYDDTVERIKSQKNGFRQLAEKTLLWISHAKRQLTTIELQHALAVDREVESGNIPRVFDNESIPGIDLIVSVCCGLVTADEESQVIRLVHYTTQEYFLRIREQWFPEAEERIANACAVYLSFDVFESGVCADDELYSPEFEGRLQSSPLYSYAAENWGYHARESNIPSQMIQEFLANNKKVQAAAQAMRLIRNDRRDGYLSMSLYITGLGLAGYFGATRLAREMLGDPNLNLEESRNEGLLYAAMTGYDDTVQLFLDKGADPNTTSKEDNTTMTLADTTPMIFAAMKGHENTVRILIRRGANPNKAGYEDWTPLVTAAAENFINIVELLLDNDADYTAYECSLGGHTAIDWAVQQGYRPMVQLFLDSIAHPIQKAKRVRSMMLSSAVGFRKAEFVRMVFEKDGDLKLKAKDGWKGKNGLKGKFGRKLLQRAVENGDSETIELLLEKGSSPDRKGIDGREQLLSKAKSIDKEWLAQKLDYYSTVR